VIKFEHTEHLHSRKPNVPVIVLPKEEKLFPAPRDKMVCVCVVCMGAQKRDVLSFGILFSVKSRKIACVIYTMVVA
jgi:hypothetical protein